MVTRLKIQVGRAKRVNLCRFEVIGSFGWLRRKSVLDLGLWLWRVVWTARQHLSNSIVPALINTQTSKKSQAKLHKNNVAGFIGWHSGDEPRSPRCGNRQWFAQLQLHVRFRFSLWYDPARMFDLCESYGDLRLLNSSYYPSRNTLKMSYHPQGVYRFCKTLCDDVSLIEGYAEGISR